MADARRRPRCRTAPSRTGWATARPSNPPEINHRRRERERASSLATTPFRTLTSPHHGNLSSDRTLSVPPPTNRGGRGFVRARTSPRNWHSCALAPPSARGSGRSAPFTLPLAHVLQRSCSCPSRIATAATRNDREASECSLSSTFALRRRELV